MPNLTKYTLTYEERRDSWVLENDRSNKAVKSFATKRDALAGGALKRAVGREGGSVKIQKTNGRIQEERTYRPCRLASVLISPSLWLVFSHY